MQVSDFGRMALIILLARLGAESDEQLRNWKVFASHLVKIAIICGLIALEPDFSIMVIIATIGISMLFLAGARLGHILMLGLSMIPVLIVMVLKTPYRMKRILGFMEMSSRKSGLGYQAYQSLVGLGNGGIFGVGLGKGEQKYFFLPEPHTDFVFSILGEELGFIGLLIILGLFGYIVYRGIKTTTTAPDRMGQLMAFGFTLMIAFYALIHASVCCGLIPTTGIPMPFLSYGGVSLVFTMSAMGILLNISSQARVSPVIVEKQQKRGKVKFSHYSMIRTAERT
jgi:cell division protein FtsW